MSSLFAAIPLNGMHGASHMIWLMYANRRPLRSQSNAVPNLRHRAAQDDYSILLLKKDPHSAGARLDKARFEWNSGL